MTCTVNPHCHPLRHPEITSHKNLPVIKLPICYFEYTWPENVL